MSRTKNSPNKITAEARALFVQNLASQTANVQIAFNELFECDKVKYLEIFHKYSSFFIPKLTETKTEITTTEAPEEFILSDAISFVKTKDN